MYIADANNQRIRKVTVSTGIITSIAGSSTSSGYSGDNGAATSATLNNPTDVALDSAGTSLLYIVTFLVTLVRLNSTIPYLGNVYIADFINQRIRKVSAGIITTVAGSGGGGSYSGDGGAATSATLKYSYSIALDSAGNYSLCTSFFLRGFTSSFHLSYLGNVYIADTGSQRIRKVTISTGFINTIAGSGSSGSFSGDNGQATSAGLNAPYGVALDAAGNSLINLRISSSFVLTTFLST